MAAVFVSQKLELTRERVTIFVLSALQMMDGELRCVIVIKIMRVHFLSKTTKFLLKI